MIFRSMKPYNFAHFLIVPNLSNLTRIIQPHKIFIFIYTGTFWYWQLTTCAWIKSEQKVSDVKANYPRCLPRIGRKSIILLTSS